MVDWQFTVFCREVEFDVIYAFLVLIFLDKYASVLFKSLFPTLALTIINYNTYLLQICAIGTPGVWQVVQLEELGKSPKAWLHHLVIIIR